MLNLHIVRAVILASIVLHFTVPAAYADDDIERIATQYGMLPTVDDVVISPDGNSIAMIETRGEQSAISIYSLETDAEPKQFAVGEFKPRSIVWASNDHVMAMLSKAQKVNVTQGLKTFEIFRHVSINKNDNKLKIMMDGDNGAFFTTSPGEFISRKTQDPDTVMFAALKLAQRNAEQTGSRIRNTTEAAHRWSLYEVNLKTGREKIIETGDENTVDWIVSPSGEPLFRVDRDFKRGQRILMKYNNRTATKIAAYNEKLDSSGSAFSIRGMSPDGKSLVVTTIKEGETSGAYEMSIADGTIGKKLYHTADYDVSGVQRDPDTGQVVAITVTDEFPQTTYIDDDMNALSRQMKRTLKTDAVSLPSFSRDRTMWVVKTHDANKPSVFYLFDRQAKSLSIIGETYPWIKEAVTIREEFDYATTDNLTINGYLTRPKGLEPKNLPLVVLPHGGPAARDTQTFDWWAAAYAAHGYAVYQPNFRGSSGYGHKLRTAGLGEWGRNMQDDITNGLDLLVTKGIADPERICIVGASYGGYAALAGATLTPDKYACAISVNGVSNLQMMLSGASKSSEYSLAYWQRQIGDRFDDREAIKAISPSEQAHQAQAPILLIHGKDDVVVPLGQSTVMAKRLKKEKKHVEFVKLDSEDHWLSRGKTRIKMLETSLKFLDENLKN